MVMSGPFVQKDFSDDQKQTPEGKNMPIKTPGAPGTGGMTRNCTLKTICLIIVLIMGALPALAQPDRYDEQDETVSPEALAQFRKGERLAKNENFDEAIAAYRQAITLQPDYAQAYHQMGLAYAGGNRYPEAVKAFKEAARLQPQMGPGLREPGGGLHQNGAVAGSPGRLCRGRPPPPR